MDEPNKFAYITATDYLKSEETSPIRREYIDGQVFAMTGTTLRHNRICVNLLGLIDNHLRGSGCHAFIAEIKARVEATNSYYYPDLMVACGAHEEDTVVESPILLVEVLSPSTQSIDRREKLYAYRQISTLKEYLIVHQNSRRVALHRRVEGDRWECQEFLGESSFVLNSLPKPLTVSLADVYRDVSEGGDLQLRESDMDEEEYYASTDW